MSAMDMDALSAAFAAHTAGSTTFTRRMAITLADMDGTTPRQLVCRCERLGLLKPGSWEWFAGNGGITRAQIDEVRATLTLTTAARKHLSGQNVSLSISEGQSANGGETEGESVVGLRAREASR